MELFQKMFRLDGSLEVTGIFYIRILFWKAKHDINHISHDPIITSYYFFSFFEFLEVKLKLRLVGSDFGIGLRMSKYMLT